MPSLGGQAGSQRCDRTQLNVTSLTLGQQKVGTSICGREFPYQFHSSPPFGRRIFGCVLACCLLFCRSSSRSAPKKHRLYNTCMPKVTKFHPSCPPSCFCPLCSSSSCPCSVPCFPTCLDCRLHCCHPVRLSVKSTEYQAFKVNLQQELATFRNLRRIDAR